MNFSIIKRTVGWILLFEALFFTVPMLTAIVYWEREFFYFLLCAGICLAVGGLLLIGKPKNRNIYAKEGFVIVALCWIVMSIFGCLPFLFSGAIPSFIDALFEAASGFSTTGASIFPTVEDLPRAILIWRSFTHWIGGMGVLVFIMAFLPLGGAQNLHIMRAESPGPTVSKLVPKMKKTAFILYLIYFILTVVMFITLLFDKGAGAENGKMSVFEAFNTAFATAGTGGFGFKNDSFAGFSD